MKHELTIWLSLSKTRPHFIESGERLVIEFFKPERRKNHQLKLTRQFFNYPDWDEAGQCSFTINEAVLRKLIKLLVTMRRNL